MAPSQPVDQLYAQVDKKQKGQKKTKEPADNITSQYSELQASDPVDQLYAQVDKKKGKKKKQGIDATPSSQAEDMAPCRASESAVRSSGQETKGKDEK